LAPTPANLGTTPTAQTCHSDRSGQSFSSLAKRALAAQWRNLSSIDREASRHLDPARKQIVIPNPPPSQGR